MQKITESGQKRRMYYIVNARIPSKKAYGIQIAKMCEAFIEAGVAVELIVPRTRLNRQSTIREFYGLRVDVPLRRMPCPDWYANPLGFAVSSALFLLMSGLFLATRRKRSICYTIDMDSFSFTLLPLFGHPVIAEMHGPKRRGFLRNFFFKQVHCIVATNLETKRELQAAFEIDENHLIVEPNGVDLQLFANTPDRDAARQKLSIQLGEKVALYVGRFFNWKELGILADTAAHMPHIAWYVVGGTAEEFKRFTGDRDLPPNLHIRGECPLIQVPLWLAAADVLLILGTKRNEESYRYTAPMKTFEYMAARRPVVASATPALKSIVDESVVRFYEPDDAESLARVVADVIAGDRNAAIIDRAEIVAREHSWKRRAERVLSVITERS